MKICIPLESDQGLESKVTGHFGNAPLFGLVDVDSGALEVVPNPELRHRHGSCHPAEGLKALDVDAIVCQGVGRRAFAALSDAGIDVLIPTDRTVTAITEAVGHGHGHAGAGCGQGHRHGQGHGQGRR